MAQDSELTVARSRLDLFLHRLAAKRSTVAVCLLSSAARAPDRLPFDEYSDFDVGVVIDVPLKPDEWRPTPSETYHLVADRVPKWVPNFSFHVTVPWGRLEVNLHQLIYQYEADPRTEWNDEKCEAYGSTAEVLFDRNGRFERLIELKVAARTQTRERRLTGLANRLILDIFVMPRRQAARGEVEAAHLILNQAVDELMEFVFLGHGRFMPNRKWRFYVLRERGLLADESLERLAVVLRCDSMSMADIERRINILAQLWEDVQNSVPGVPQNAYKTFCASQLQLQRATPADMLGNLHGDEWYDLMNYLVMDRPC